MSSGCSGVARHSMGRVGAARTEHEGMLASSLIVWLTINRVGSEDACQHRSTNIQRLPRAVNDAYSKQKNAEYLRFGPFQ